VGSSGRARVTATEFGKSVEERGEFRAQHLEVWEAPDPMKEIAEKHVGPGMRAKFLNPDRVARDGPRGFEVVKDENGDPVKLGRMVLGQMPEERAQARDRFYRKKGADRLQRITEEHEERQRELVA
jgi:hypothetical protein